MRRISANLAIALTSLVASTVWAQDPNPAASINLITAPLFIAAGIAYVTRRMAIGGWLFYFYLILIMQMLLVAFMFVGEIKTTSIEGWDPFYYWLSWADYLSYALAKTVCLGFGIRLWSKAQRTQKNLRYMRIILGIVLLTAISRAVMNSLVWQEDIQTILGGVALFSSVLWFTYWLVSRRVKYIFTLQGTAFSYDDFKEQVKQGKSNPPA